MVFKQDSEGRAHSMQHGATGEAARNEQGGDADSGFDVSVVTQFRLEWIF